MWGGKWVFHGCLECGGVVFRVLNLERGFIVVFLLLMLMREAGFVCVYSIYVSADKFVFVQSKTHFHGRKWERRKEKKKCEREEEK